MATLKFLMAFFLDRLYKKEKSRRWLRDSLGFYRCYLMSTQYSFAESLSGTRVKIEEVKCVVGIHCFCSWRQIYAPFIMRSKFILKIIWGMPRDPRQQRVFSLP